ncbi:MAG TPA: outer membrane beta-barrel protein [Terracidiphilus sp.]|jgi:opacity protein-like surface antigen
MGVKLTSAIFAVVAVVGSACASAQTDVGLSLYGAFSGTVDENGITQSPAATAGGIFELRHIANPILGFEGTYSYNRANRHYVCPTSCGDVTFGTIKADAHQVTVDWVPSVHVLNLRPFGVLGIGGLFNVPQGSDPQVSTKTGSQVVYVYGAGLDVTVIPHFGLRFQYRGNLYKPPDVTDLFTSADKFTHTAQPMVGIFIRL